MQALKRDIVRGMSTRPTAAIVFLLVPNNTDGLLEDAELPI